jgi:hypothetical protein
LNVQGLKDTFYSALQARIAAGNPARTFVQRGVLRPGVLVVENELPATTIDGIAPAEVFCLRWTSLQIDPQTADPLVKLGCEIQYASDGTTAGAGMDRGRALAAMDAELVTALTTVPMNTAGTLLAEIAGGGSSVATTTGTQVFWGDAAFGAVVERGERLERSALVEVFGYGE